MALSFEESKKQLSQQVAATPMLMSLSAEPMLMSLSNDASGETWEPDTKYAWFDSFVDDKISYIDDNKNITIDNSQVNISQESNSQFIPFEMTRKYDGIDLAEMALSVHFTTSDGQHFASKPVNVKYSDDKIRFAWLVDTNATHIDGNIKFEIHADGAIADSAGTSYGYRWKSKSTDKFNILKSLCQDPNCEPVVVSDDWVQEIVENVATSVAEKVAAAQVDQQVTEAKQAAADAQQAAQEAQSAVQSELENYYTKEEVDTAISNVEVDLTGYATETYVQEQIDAIPDPDLSNYALKTDIPTVPTNVSAFNNDAGYLNEHQSLEGLATEEYVQEAVAAVDVSDQLADYAKVADVYNKTEVDAAIANVEVDLSGYYTKTEVDAKTDTLSSSIGTNATNISSLSETVTGLQETVNGIDTSPRLTYDATYNTEGDYSFVLYEIENEGDSESEVRSEKAKFVIQGGGGGTSTSSTLKIEYVTKTPLVITTNDTAVITYNFSGTDSSGDAVMEGNATWKVAGSVVATNIAVSGENSFDVTEYLSLGTQKVQLSITDDAGSLVTKTWTVQKIDVRIESTFNDQLTYPIGTVSFDYTPYGAISKDVHFILDGVEIGTVTTSASGVPMAYTIPEQEHGAHLFEVYMTAVVNNNTIESNHIYKDIIWFDSTSDIPVIGCAQQEFTALQYDSTNITYTVYDPTTEAPVVTLAVDGDIISTLTLDNSTQVWQYKSTEVGPHVLTITCGETVKTLNATIEELDINLEPVTAGLVFDFNPSGKSNNDADRLWSDGDISMTVSDNFDWVNGGYQIDENGDQYFCVKAGTSAVINYNLFEDDAKRNGKEFKLIFKTTNVKSASAQFLSCVDGSDTAKIGIEMNVHEAYIHASAGSLYLPYSEEDVIEFEFNINKDTNEIPMVMGYEDGVATRPMVYSDSHNFTQNTPQYITIGSDDCDVFIYRFKVYNAALTDKGILNNFIADARNAEEMISRYNRNQIYDENNQLTPEILAEKCPQLRIFKIEAPHFTNNKSDKVTGTTIQCIYKDGRVAEDNWTAYNSQHSGQGTTSNEYGAAGRNLDLIMNKSGVDGVTPYIVLGDGTEANKISLTSDSVEVAYLNVKVNIASSENANNALLQRRYNTYNPYVRPAKQNDSKVKDTMEFYNCVVFIKESDPDVTTHREFDDTEWHFYAIGNVGDSKKTDNTRLNDPDDPLECIVEIMDNTFPNSTFPSDEEGLANLELDPFDESMTYGWRYSYDDSDPEVTGPCIEAWKEFYKFVVTSTDEEFKANLGNYFVVDSALYFYLFTTRYTMIDNRAKNTFWHYGKCEDGVYRWDLCFNYDNDTALGINNSGELTMTYGYEDTDYKTKGDESTGYAFNAATSTFFCRIRDLFADELSDMFVQCESAGAWSAEGLINQFDSFQSEFPEELWRLDIERKYLRPYRDGNTRFLNQMANGRKKYQRRQFERNQEKYMASKFFGNVAVADQIMFRCNTPTDANIVVAPNYTLYLTPYSDMYLDVMFGATYRTQVRAEAGKQYTITCPFTTMDDTAVLVYCASMIQSMGDLSACYIHDNDFSKASKLKELIIGNATEGYQNSFLTNLGIGNNTLLEKLDIQNTPNLAQALNLSNCNNLRELYAYGSGLTGITFADGGMIEIAQLPAITALTMKNLIYLTNFNVSSFDNLTTLVAENCSTVDIQNILDQTNSINRVRIIGINWSLDDTTLLDRIYSMSGIDKSGYNISQSVLAGKVYVPVIKEKQLQNYQSVWPDLEITYSTLVAQYAVTFVNQDGTILDIQYVDKGTKPVDPITREENPIETPTLASTVSTDYTFAGWDTTFVDTFADTIIRATYTESIREYTIKYASKGNVLQETKANYGTIVSYTGEIPTYTSEESAYKYYLFDGWDKSGYVNGDKTINAVYDSCEYNAGYFDGKDLSTMRPVEVYAMMQLGLESQYAESKDVITISLGNDASYEDIEEKVLISEKTVFSGSNYIDTNEKLFSEDKDFVLAIDYSMTSTTSGNILAQCYSDNGMNGFKLWYNSGIKLSLGSSSMTPSSNGNREMLVIRHIKGETGIHVYVSNTSSASTEYVELSGVRSPIHDSTLVFGCGKADDGAYENYATGTVYWSKVWYADLGDDVCSKIAYWPHETIDFEMCGFKRYYLSNNSSKRCSMSFLANSPLNRTMALNTAGTTTGGWGAWSLNEYLNNRIYNAFPDKWKQLMKQVKVKSSIGDQSIEIAAADCYITIPAAIEMDSSKNTDPYISEGSAIDYFTTADSRILYDKDGNAVTYWLRSPNKDYPSYAFVVRTGGDVYGFNVPTSLNYVRIMFSI